MKTKAIKIAFAAIIIMTTSIVSVNAQDSYDFFFDRKYVNEQIISKEKYELVYPGLYEKKYLYEYSYNEFGRLVKEEIYKWNSKKSTWIPVYCIDHIYSLLDNSLTLEYTKWSKKENKFDPVSERAIYQMDEYGNIISCTTLKTNDKDFNEMTMQWSKNEIYF